MKKYIFLIFFVHAMALLSIQSANGQSNSLKVVLIRHAEKPDNGDNLNCKGLNRSIALPAALQKRVGIPAYVYVPGINQGTGTKRSRAFQTVIPLSAKYNVSINTAFDVEDAKGLAEDVLAKNKLVLVCWEHHQLTKLAKAFGIKSSGLKWGDQDYDSMWIITYTKGKATLTISKEALNPKDICPN